MGASPFNVRDWSIVPGPASIQPPFDSTGLTEIEEYPPETASSAVLAVPSTELIFWEQPDWWSWAARWASGSSYIDLEMTLFDVAPFAWGGFHLSGSATQVQLLELYRQIHAVLPASWLHDSACALHTAESFVNVVRAA
jgi:hypothetical protein